MTIEELIEINTRIVDVFMNTPIAILRIVDEDKIEEITYYPRYEKRKKYKREDL